MGRPWGDVGEGVAGLGECVWASEWVSWASEWVSWVSERVSWVSERAGACLSERAAECANRRRHASVSPPAPLIRCSTPPVAAVDTRS